MDIDRRKLFLFLRSCRNDDGGFGSKPGSESNMESTRFGFQSLLIREDGRSIREWLRKCQDRASGAFNPCPGAEPDLASTYYALVLLREVDGFGYPQRPSASEDLKLIGGHKVFKRCVRWILRHQGLEGGFASKEGQQSDIDNTFYARTL